MPFNERALWELEQSAVAELREYIVDEGNTREDDVRDRISEIADSHVPVYNWDLLELVSNNLMLGYWDSDDCLDLSDEGDIFTIIMRTTFRHLEEHLCEKMEELIEEREALDEAIEESDEEAHIAGLEPQRFPDGTLVSGNFWGSGNPEHNDAVLVGTVERYDADDGSYLVKLTRPFSPFTPLCTVNSVVWLINVEAVGGIDEEADDGGSEA